MASEARVSEARSSDRTDPNRDQKSRRLILIVGGIIVLAMTYGSGMSAMKRQVMKVDQQRRLLGEDLRTEQRASRLRLAAAEQLEARRQVSLALQELDQRNFGTAQQHVAEAARLLGVAQKNNTANPDLSAVQAALAQTTLVAAADVGAQRTGLLGQAAAMDRAFDAYTPPFLKSGQSDDDAHPVAKPTMNDVPNPSGAHEMSQAD